ncbi:MAG: hypothetical protein M3377_10720, partial [Actinomycetota bacterium]|nr:hypothetical protein [Actinomycetota bacterium]
MSLMLVDMALPLGEVAAWAIAVTALAVAAAGALFLRARTRRSALTPTGAHTDGAGEQASGSGGGMDALARLSTALSGSGGSAEAVEHLFDEVQRLPGVEAALLTLVDEDGKRATGFASRGVDAAWWRGISVELEHEAGGI